ncbi:secretion system protein [Hyphomonas neptunium ATCC 15444]|uniref:Secretion system protein n=2 Tax=Hyphomonas TaxID=85 RepID=Q0BXV6_HYPNA|nr:type II secretion system F family protein [Hyphomonas neptunium]ABI76348.1 secretion system protein [Hyphomonas neptunium ATCC 15444]
MIPYIVAALAFLAIAGLGLVLTGGNDDAARKRARAISAGRGGAPVKGGKVVDENIRRRAKTQEMLEGLRRQDKERRRNDPMRNIGSKLTQAGLEIPVPMFWLLSAVCGLICAGIVYISGADGLVINGISLKSRPVLIAAAFFGGTLGIPQFILNFLIKGRHTKMINQFADALDIIVRGVRSGLPLNECIRVIAKESPEPLRKEFLTFADNLAMGAGLERSLAALYKRLPLQEINFFAIVLIIQSKAGGNLSEALHNLSTVIRSRKMMREKVKALSSEAKASAMIIGSLPIAVGVMVFLTTPDYIMTLFTTETGHVILVVAVGMMGSGITVMRNMMNFDM